MSGAQGRRCGRRARSWVVALSCSLERAGVRGSSFYIGGVYGQAHATVWMLGPDGMLSDVTSDDDPKVGGDCGGSIANEGTRAQTGECIFVIPVGQTYVIHPTLQDATPL